MIAVAILLTLVVGFIALLHVYWGLGGLWPASDERMLALTVIGTGQTRMPPEWQCNAVALLLAAVAAWPWLVVILPEESFVLAGLMVIVSVFLMRAIAVVSPRWRMHFPAQPFATNDRRYYGPLCFTLALGYAVMMNGMQT